MGFVPPPYPHDRLRALEEIATKAPGGIVDCSIGTPVDPMPDVVVQALIDTAAQATGYPLSVGSLALRTAAADWLGRRFRVAVAADEIIGVIGTKELVASLPRALSLRDPSRDTVLYPAVSYPTYAMGAQLAGLRAVPVPVDDRWNPVLDGVAESDAARALMVWLNDPANPTGVTATPAQMTTAVAWARDRGIVVASDECYAEFAPRTSTILSAGSDGMIAVHSVSKRSNLAGMRVGFYAGDPDVVEYLIETRKHAGLMAPTPVQAAAAAALGDDAHVEIQRTRYRERRLLVEQGLVPYGLVHDGGDALFYLWLRAADDSDDGWEIAARLAETAGLLVSPGDFYGPAGADHVRLALVQPRERLELALDRMVRATA